MAGLPLTGRSGAHSITGDGQGGHGFAGYVTALALLIAGLTTFRVMAEADRRPASFLTSPVVPPG
jgi:hypothetical protein